MLTHEAERKLVELGHTLHKLRYRFITVTPQTHQRVAARPHAPAAATLHDALGWSRPFEPRVLPRAVVEGLQEAGMLAEANHACKAALRCSSLGDDLFFHSAFPTTAAASVFFGPDTYRFARWITECLRRFPPVTMRPRIADIGCGSGAGGIHASRVLMNQCELELADISDDALCFARVNAQVAGLPARIYRSDLYESVPDCDLILCNPPYLVDPAGRLYRDGGGALGSDLSIRAVAEGLPKLRPGGMLVLYTGSPIIRGRDLLREALAAALAGHAVQWQYEELDPDVFGEELSSAAYADADRIAAVGLLVRREG